MLNKDIEDKHSLYSLLLVLSGILTDKNGNAKCMLVFFFFQSESALRLLVCLAHCFIFVQIPFNP